MAGAGCGGSQGTGEGPGAKMKKNLIAIDVCAGAGGWAVAARGLPIEIVAAIDWNEDCLATYKRNFPSVETVLADVTTYDFSRFTGRVDLILGGLPCEPISSARRAIPLRQEEAEKFKLLVDRCLEIPRTIGATWWCYEDVRDLIAWLPPFTPHFLFDAAAEAMWRIEHYLAKAKEGMRDEEHERK